MRWSLLSITVFSLIIFTAVKLSDSALAVVDKPATVMPKAKIEEAVSSRIDIPVFWRLTKTNFLRKGVAARTESFREVWTLETRTQGGTFLVSPRGEVPVYKTNQAISGSGTLPESILVLEKDFAKLIGAGQNWDEENEVSEQKGKLVTLVITKPPKGGVEMTLNISEAERFAVHFSVGTPVSF